SPQPARQSGQMLGLSSATPGTSSSSGTKRMTWCSGLPQLARVALVPQMAVSLMKSRRSITVDGVRSPPLKMTRETVVRRPFLPMTVHAESHIEIHIALGHRLLGDVAVTRRAIDVRADVRGMVEAHVHLVRVPVDPLPSEVDSLVLQRGHLLNQRAVGRNRGVAD